MRNFKELKIWQVGFQIATNCVKLASGFPSMERFGLASQISRAGVSIPSNIAEGSSRGSEKDYRRFIEIAIGSAYELETHLLIARSIQYGDQNLLNNTLDLVYQVQRMLSGFIRILCR